jgi:hypothetical protein
VDQQGHSHQDRAQVARCSADDLPKHLATDIGELANPSGVLIGRKFESYRRSRFKSPQP